MRYLIARLATVDGGFALHGAAVLRGAKAYVFADPGLELFIDPEIRWPMLAVGWRMAKRKLGMRTLLDVISLKDTQLVKGSHGRITDDPQHGPLVISSRPDLLPEGAVEATAFKQLVLDHLFA